MKQVQVFLVLAVVASAFCGPVTTKLPEKDSSEETYGPMDEPFNGGVVDTGFPSGYFGNPLPLSFGLGNPFSGFWRHMEESMQQLQRQINTVLNRLPEEGNVSAWGPVADGKGNTTSTVKVINGHKVTINETVYADEADKNSGSFFKIRIVQVNPTSEEDTPDSKESDEATTLSQRFNKEVEETTPKSIKEPGEKGSPDTYSETDNEIPRSNQQEKTYPSDRDVELIGDDASDAYYPDLLSQDIIAHPSYYNYHRNNELDTLEPIHDINTNDVNSVRRDLSDDIYINQMLADQGYPHDSRSEVFEVEPNYYGRPLNDDSFYNHPRYYYEG